eukprot:CAMPEP_0113940572 /NCGR_PEP_ID=MMETSP1339-20121228/6679_1 /TAXON_ID=94617 /ORGANISM="Fibrocapsa japonica" /LENGTH=243 /DNA_ID=CAMNT_0000944447 /DNA_START=60 /DNA_END=791 /DNA_ORIENTATION=- /assembly_acc=CAM_ASM_000762
MKIPSCTFVMLCIAVPLAQGFSYIGTLSKSIGLRNHYCGPLRSQVDTSEKQEAKVKFQTKVVNVQDESLASLRKQIDSEGKKPRVRSVNSLLLEELEQIDIPDPATLTDVSYEIKPAYVDLNGIQPFQAILGSLLAAGLSFGAWKFTNAMTIIYANQSAKLAQSDILMVSRMTGFMRQVIVGSGSLATGVFGFTSLGMLLMGVRVAYGVAKGELDPTYVDPEKEKKSIDLADVNEVLSKTKLE